MQFKVCNAKYIIIRCTMIGEVYNYRNIIIDLNLKIRQCYTTIKNVKNFFKNNTRNYIVYHYVFHSLNIVKMVKSNLFKILSKQKFQPYIEIFFLNKIKRQLIIINQQYLQLIINVTSISLFSFLQKKEIYVQQNLVFYVIIFNTRVN